MSKKICKKNIKSDELEKIKMDCTIIGKCDYGPPPVIEAYAETSKNIYLPIGYNTETWPTPHDNSAWKRASFTFYDKDFPFRTDGGRDQKIVYEQSLKLLNTHNCLLLSLFCGYGKTFEAVKISQHLGYKTAFLIHRKSLAAQAIQSYKQFSNAIVQVVKKGTQLDPNAHVYIINIARIADIAGTKLQFFHDIGTLIIDEAHICGAKIMAKALLYFCPRYAIALTATPKRNDGMDKILELYFGMPKTQIVRIAQEPFIVKKLFTGIKPTTKTSDQGRVIWGSIVGSLSHNPMRNETILKCVQEHSNKTILILTMYVAHVRELSKLFKLHNIKHSCMVGTDSNYEKTPVLLSTFSKLGVGFDDSRLDMYINAMSTKNIEQFAGRLRDVPGKQRIIVDLIDDHFICKKHWTIRQAFYISRNGKIVTYSSHQVVNDPSPSPPSETPRVRLSRKY